MPPSAVKEDTLALPEQLPPDIATRARALWAQGLPRQALALLYRASVMAVEAYQLPFPKWLITLTGYAQPFVEIAVGLLLIVGMFTRIGAALGVLAMIIFIAGITWAWTQGLRIDCGCFSAGGELSADEETRYLQDIIRDLGLMACGLWLMIGPTSVLAVDNWLLAPGAADETILDSDEPPEGWAAEPATPKSLTTN